MNIALYCTQTTELLLYTDTPDPFLCNNSDPGSCSCCCVGAIHSNAWSLYEEWTRICTGILDNITVNLQRPSRPQGTDPWVKDTDDVGCVCVCVCVTVVLLYCYISTHMFSRICTGFSSIWGGPVFLVYTAAACIKVMFMAVSRSSCCCYDSECCGGYRRHTLLVHTYNHSHLIVGSIPLQRYLLDRPTVLWCLHTHTPISTAAGHSHLLCDQYSFNTHYNSNIHSISTSVCYRAVTQWFACVQYKARFTQSGLVSAIEQ